MRVKTVSLFGFKSFADRTRLEFHEGITGIVGPNGCGKSNISDAFRWLFGEQSAKSLRGDKMQDVIFAGTATRKPLNLAEVTIVFADVEGKLLVDANEVEVTRRLLRSGESEYFINRQKSRLKDVLDLFLDSGIGRDSFAIFEQGKIDQVIHNTPLERRVIFEETAGIRLFLQRKRESLKKLALVDENLLRLNDIVQEVERVAASLEKQAEKAKSYKELKASLELLEKQIAFAKAMELKSEIQALQVKIDASAREVEACGGAQKERVAKQERQKRQLDEAQNHLKGAQEALYQTKNERSLLLQEKESEKKWFTDLKLRVERAKLELASLKEKGEALLYEREKVLAALEEASAALALLQGEAKTKREELSLLDVRLNALLQEQKERERKRFLLADRERSLESLLSQGLLKVQYALERREKASLEVGSLNESLKGVETLLQIKNTSIEALKGAEAEKRQGLSKLEKELDVAKAELFAVGSERQALMKKIVELRMRLQALNRLKEEHEGISTSSKAVLKEKKGKLLSEELAAEEGAEDQLAEVMRPYSQTLLVESDEALEGVLTWADGKGLKDLSFFSLSRLKEGQSLQSYFMDGATFVKGGVVDPKGVLFYKTTGENRVFLREKERKALDLSLKDLQEKEGVLQQREGAAAQVQERFSKQKALLEGELKVLEKSLFQEEMERKRAAAERESLAQRGTRLSDELAALEKDLTLQEAFVIEKRGELSRAQEERAAFEQEGQQREGELARERSAFGERREALNELTKKVHESESQVFKLTHERDLNLVKEEELTRLKKRLNSEIEESFKKETLFKENEITFEKALELVETRLEEAALRLKEREVDVVQRKEALNTLEKEIDAGRGILSRLTGEQNQLVSAKNTLEVRLEAFSPEEVEPLKIALASAERKVSDFNRKLQEAGEINFTAIEAFEEQRSRGSFLKVQMEDLIKSKNELSQIIAELEGKSKKAFKETFEAVRGHFQSNFQTLFNGGFADLTFTDPEVGVLEAGIEIVAKPPGKHMQSIQLLSGGEKCLTAMALLFAIFSVKPSPFCILDEIDAPLDDTNVLRLNRLIQEFQKKSQFIIITHNKVTMKQADRLFGVSMEERGVSKILSVTFEKEKVLV